MPIDRNHNGHEELIVMVIYRIIPEIAPAKNR